MFVLKGNVPKANLTAGDIIAQAFVRGPAPMFIRVGKDPHRTPMALRWQAGLRKVLTDARIRKGIARGSKWTKNLVRSVES